MRLFERDNTPYRALEILADLASFRPKFDWDYDDFSEDACIASFEIDGFVFTVTAYVKGESYRGASHDPYYTYEGFRQTGLNVRNIMIEDVEGDRWSCDNDTQFDVWTGYEFSEAAQYIMRMNSDVFSYENWMP